MKTEKYQRQPWEWADDEVIMACMDYTTRSAILRNNRSAYICIAYRNLWNKLTWLRDRCSERSHKMDDNEIIERSREYTGLGRGGFQLSEPKLYAMAYRRGLLDKMPWLDDPESRTTAQLIELAKGYNNLERFKQAEMSAFVTLRRRGALDSVPWLSDTPTETNKLLESIRSETESAQPSAKLPAQPSAKPVAVPNEPQS